VAGIVSETLFFGAKKTLQNFVKFSPKQARVDKDPRILERSLLKDF